MSRFARPVALALTLVAVGPTGSAADLSGSYELQVYASGADPARDNPFRTTVIPASAVRCDQAGGVAPAIPINPTSVRWRDPGNASRDCVADATTFLRTLPARAEPYLATLTVATASGTSSRSAASNIFFRVAAFREP